MITDDVGRLFSAMQANYGHRWPHRADAIPVWLHKLKGFTLPEVMRAADKAMDLYPSHPPTAAQFADVCRGHRPANTYLPPPEIPQHVAQANHILFAVLLEHGAIEDKVTLMNMIALKNAVAVEYGTPCEELRNDLMRQLVALHPNAKSAARSF